MDNYEFDFMMKIDDDSFLRLDWLMDEVEHLPKEREYTGISIGNFRPERDKSSPWYMPPELWPNPSGPVILTGIASHREIGGRFGHNNCDSTCTRAQCASYMCTRVRPHSVLLC